MSLSWDGGILSFWDRQVELKGYKEISPKRSACTIA